MKIDCTLSETEKDTLALMMGFATARVVSENDPEMARTGVRLMNKLFALSPDYRPYDEKTFDSLTGKFPFRFRAIPR
jgi:hypothetical protein